MNKYDAEFLLHYLYNIIQFNELIFLLIGTKRNLTGVGWDALSLVADESLPAVAPLDAHGVADHGHGAIAGGFALGSTFQELFVFLAGVSFVQAFAGFNAMSVDVPDETFVAEASSYAVVSAQEGERVLAGGLAGGAAVIVVFVVFAVGVGEN